MGDSVDDCCAQYTSYELNQTSTLTQLVVLVISSKWIPVNQATNDITIVILVIKLVIELAKIPFQWLWDWLWTAGARPQPMRTAPLPPLRRKLQLCSVAFANVIRGGLATTPWAVIPGCRADDLMVNDSVIFLGSLAAAKRMPGKWRGGSDEDLMVCALWWSWWFRVV